MNESKLNERKMARQRQLEMMEAAAGGVPSRQVDLLDDAPSGIRSRSGDTATSARRLLFDDDEDLNLVSASTRRTPAFPPAPAAGGLFERREYPVDQSVNLMDPNAGMMDERGGIFRSLSNRIPVFRASTGQEMHLEHDAAVSTEGDEFLGDINKRRADRVPTIMAFLAQRKRMVCLVVTVFLVVLGLVTLTGGKDEVKEPTEDDLYRAVILGSGITTEERLLDHKSGAHKAFSWIVHRDRAQLEPNDPYLLERFALATTIYETTDDGETFNSINEGRADAWHVRFGWLTGKGICAWGGVECERQVENGDYENEYDEDGHVVHLNLTLNGIEGIIPPELAALSKLRMLDLSKNVLSGSLPTELGRMTDIELFLLEENGLSGSIPKEYSNFAKVTDFHVGTNYLTGTIPREFNKLTSLHSLGLDENDLTGTIPDLSQLTNLAILYLDDNHLEGQLPSSMSALTNLIDLRVRKNSLTGTIPPAWSSLSNLDVIYLDNNKLSGPAPIMLIENAQNLTQLHLYENELTGPVPTILGSLAGLRVLYMDSNELTGHFPSELGNLQFLEALFLSNNKLGGSLPSEVGMMVALHELRLSGNQLTGEIPSEIGNLGNLERLFLHSNEFFREVPSEIGNISGLRSFRLYENYINGNMPDEICALTPDRGGPLEVLAADCNAQNLISCSCCDQCYPMP